jgi:potassium-transporting ATPase KdpC subunit
MKQIKISLILFLIMTLLTGIVYPLLMTGIAQLAFREKAGGSLVSSNGHIAGSSLIGQNFTGKGYFHGRPSANSYDGANSGGSNFGPTNKKFIDQTAKLAKQVRRENGLASSAEIPAELVLSSASGLDPHIGINSALIQTARIARERKIGETLIRDLINRNSEMRYFGLFGDSFVNVFKLNLALDARGKSK